MKTKVITKSKDERTNNVARVHVAQCTVSANTRQNHAAIAHGGRVVRFESIRNDNLPDIRDEGRQRAAVNAVCCDLRVSSNINNNKRIRRARAAPSAKSHHEPDAQTPNHHESGNNWRGPRTRAHRRSGSCGGRSVDKSGGSFRFQRSGNVLPARSSGCGLHLLTCIIMFPRRCVSRARFRRHRDVAWNRSCFQIS